MNKEFIWTDGMELALLDIKENSLNYSESHKMNYYFYKSYLKYFRIPTIILSGLNSVFSVGLQPYIAQNIISVLCCTISLICGIIASIELFLGIQNIMERELISSKDYYILSYDIFKILSIEREFRMIDGKAYLDDTHIKYCNLIESANLLDKKTNNYDFLKKIDKVEDYSYLFEKEKRNFTSINFMDQLKTRELNDKKEEEKEDFIQDLENH